MGILFSKEPITKNKYIIFGSYYVFDVLSGHENVPVKLTIGFAVHMIKIIVSDVRYLFPVQILLT